MTKFDNQITAVEQLSTWANNPHAHIPDVQNKEVSKSLPVKLLKEILSAVDGDYPSIIVSFVNPKLKKLDLMLWLSKNGCTVQDRREMSDCFDFDDFTTEELLTNVRMSGIYSDKRIDDKVLEIWHLQRSQLADQTEEISKLEPTFSALRKENIGMNEEITRLRAALHHYNTLTEQNKILKATLSKNKELLDLYKGYLNQTRLKDSFKNVI